MAYCPATKTQRQELPARDNSVLARSDRRDHKVTWSTLCTYVRPYVDHVGQRAQDAAPTVSGEGAFAMTLGRQSTDVAEPS
jgi:hypothetical protein